MANGSCSPENHGWERCRAQQVWELHQPALEDYKDPKTGAVELYGASVGTMAKGNGG